MTTPTDIFGTCILQSVRRAARAATALYDSHLSRVGLTAPQFGVVIAVAAHPRAPVGRLAEALGMDRTTLLRALGPLERDGWVAIRPDRLDARLRLVELGTVGQARLDEAIRLWDAAQSMVMTRIGAEDWARAQAALRAIEG